MATIHYRFFDGHVEKIEVSEEFAKIYGQIDETSRRNDWKFDYRNRKLNASFEYLTEQGFDVADQQVNIEGEVLKKEFLEKIESITTKRQWEIFHLAVVLDLPNTAVADKLGITEGAVRDCLKSIEKKYLKKFGETPTN